MAKVAFTAARVSAFRCPPEKIQAFLWDAISPGLGLRATPNGRPAYVFQGVYRGKDVRVTIGRTDAWTISDAQSKARALQRLIDEGKDPRDLKRDAIAAADAKLAAAAAKAEADKFAAVTVGEAWDSYLEERRPFWGERHYADHLKMAKAGGETSKRGLKLAADGLRPSTMPGPLFQLRALPLRELTSSVIEQWAAQHAESRATYARLCWRCLKVFLNWCSEHPHYSSLLPSANPAKTKRARELLGKPTTHDDSLERGQLATWFAAIRQTGNPIVAAYLQVTLLTGARPGETLTLRWEDVDFRWKSMTIRDKDEGERVIPLTPYVSHLISSLPRRNEWVFSSTRALSVDPISVKRRESKHARKGSVAPLGNYVHASASGHLTDPGSTHRAACAAIGLEGLTLHGLRRSFATLSEWLEIPAGVVAQIQGHKPSATAEKHYKRRPLDLLRVHHERIESWILQQASVIVEVA